MLREANGADLPQMLALADKKRQQYEAYSPHFWRRADDATEKQAPYFCAQLSRDNTICLVSEEAGEVNGFIIASIVSAPPVYDPGGPVCMIDDFAVAESADWKTTGRDLLDEMRRLAVERHAPLSVVVCGHLDEPKREMLRSAGFSIASEWYVSP